MTREQHIYNMSFMRGSTPFCVRHGGEWYPVHLRNSFIYFLEQGWLYRVKEGFYDAADIYRLTSEGEDECRKLFKKLFK